jgi:hypothetical protein
MRYQLIYATILPILLFNLQKTTSIRNNSVQKIRKVSDIPPPAGFCRIKKEPGTFENWLSEVKLKNDKTVYLYNGTKKHNQQAQYAVLDIPTGTKDLQQCADAVMRLRAGFLYSAGRYEEIVFYDNLKHAYTFQTPYNLHNFEKYLEKVFAWCGTLSLEKQLKPISNYADIEAGDVFIHGGSPGHAVIVIDIAVNKRNEKVFMLAQSYMPAQDIHILINPHDLLLSPWYTLPKQEQLVTPEWIFHKLERKRW